MTVGSVCCLYSQWTPKSLITLLLYIYSFFPFSSLPVSPLFLPFFLSLSLYLSPPLPQRKQRRGSIISLGTPPPEARTYRDILKDDNSPSPSIKKDLLEVSFEFANDSTLTRKPSPRLFPRHSSTQSLDSLSSENTGMEEKSILTNQNRVAKVTKRGEGGRKGGREKSIRGERRSIREGWLSCIVYYSSKGKGYSYGCIVGSLSSKSN